MKIVLAVLCAFALAAARKEGPPVFSAEQMMLAKNMNGTHTDLYWPWSYPRSACVGEMYYTPLVTWYGDLDDYYWSDFNVVAFDSVIQDSTDVDTSGTKIGGRVATGNNFRVKSTGSVGRQSTAPWRNYVAVIGNNLEFETGNFEPDGRGAQCNIGGDCPQENLWVGGDPVDTPEYLVNRIRGTCGDFFKGNCLDLAFSRAWVYYKTVSAAWAYHPSNCITQIRTEWNGKTVIISAAVPDQERYYVTIDANTLTDANNFVLQGFNDDAEFVVTFPGSQDLVFCQGKWPTLKGAWPGRTVFNVPGTREISIDNTRVPHLLAPSATVSQTESRIQGYAVVYRISSLDTVYWIDCSDLSSAGVTEKAAVDPRAAFPKFI